MIKELFDLKQSLEKSKIKGIALDIDETLSATLPYWVKTMQENFGNPEGLSIPELIKKYRFFKNVPYWQSPEACELAQKLRDSNDLQIDLDVLKDADKYIQKVIDLVPVVAYITARPEGVMSGTKQWLEKYNFPKAPIIALPKYISTENANFWKAEVLEFLYPHVLGIIDDNYEMLDYVQTNYRGHLFIYDAKPENFPTSRERVYLCPDWDSVISQIKMLS
jgi:5'(3')-deoxyribonucleotidase